MRPSFSSTLRGEADSAQAERVRGQHRRAQQPPLTRFSASRRLGLFPKEKGKRRAAILATVLFLGACQSAAPSRDYAEFRSSRDAVSVASGISEQMRACWFGGDRSAFAGYSYAPELNSFSGRPRVLVVQKSDPTGLPKLVVEASEAGRGSSVKLFGPLMASGEAPAISRDVGRWAGGETGC